MEQVLEYKPWLLFLVSLIAGLILQKLFTHHVSRLASRTKWKWDDLIIESIGRFPLYWCMMAGAYAFLLASNIASDEHQRLCTRLLITIVIFSITLVAARLVGGVVRKATQSPARKATSTSLFANGSRIVVYVIGGIAIMQNLNIAITPIITALGLGGLAVALALEETLNNLFCGIQIVATQFIRTGDYVKLDSGHEGYVTDIEARNTTICAFPDNNRIIVPNSKIASSTIINYSMPVENLWITIPVGVSYDSDLEQVEEVTIAVGREILSSVEGGSPEQEPVLVYTDFGESSIDFNIRLYIKQFRDQFEIKHRFIKALHKRYRQEGISIPYPIRTLQMLPNSGLSKSELREADNDK